MAIPIIDTLLKLLTKVIACSFGSLANTSEPTMLDTLQHQGFEHCYKALSTLLLSQNQVQDSEGYDEQEGNEARSQTKTWKHLTCEFQTVCQPLYISKTCNNSFTKEPPKASAKKTGRARERAQGTAPRR